MSTQELPETRLATTDEKGNRVYIHPIEVKGKWNRLRKYFSWVLIFIYLVVPWTYIDGKQIILLDLPKREFYIFGTTFYGHDGPMLIYLLLGFLFFISFVTSLWGRVWCGYACPQTVFIEQIYRVIEKWVEGSPRKREKLQTAPWTREKVFKRGIKWFLFLIVSLHIVHSGLGYFVGTHELLYISTQSPTHHLGLFITMLVLTTIILVDFGWFREQFCIIACPYGRFQSIVMDENSLVVSYDEKRGEPRKRTAGVQDKDVGDCVNCNMCVKACPTGIDIRDGLQMECIACTACIDACDDIMDRVHKPRGLIRYTTQTQLEGKNKKTSPRVFVYLTLLTLVMVGLISHLQIRKDLKVQLIRAGKVPYQTIERQGESPLIVNHYQIKISHYGQKGEKLQININNQEQYPGLEIIIPEDVIELDGDNDQVGAFFKFPKELLQQGQREITISFVNSETKKIIKTMGVKLVGPIR